MNTAYIIAAKRTPVAPRNGALSHYAVTELGARVIQAAIKQAGLLASQVDYVLMGNALYGGGNPSRVAALAAGLPETTPAMTIDTQCCAGLDAINLACTMVENGAASCVVAGGLESFSRSPIRKHRPASPDQRAVEYQRPPFTPWPERDPDMLESAAELAKQRGISRGAQELFAIQSHDKAYHYNDTGDEILDFEGVTKDNFTRQLSEKICARAPLICGDETTGLTASTVAVEADACACVIVVNEKVLSQLNFAVQPIRAAGYCSMGTDPVMPSLAPVAATNNLLEQNSVLAAQLACAEIMEAFAVQAMACIDDCGIDPHVVNRSGGALARGHPIGASGAVLAVRLWYELQRETCGSLGLIAIAAAGGLGTAALWKTE